MSALLTLAAPICGAATWRVAQDGSGDFDNLFAVSAAVANGDTVLIAAGVYDSTASFVGLAGSRTTCFPVPVADLTIIGVGQADVIIGPPDLTQTTTAGPFAIYGVDGATTIHLANVTVRNSWVGLNARAGGTVSNCRFSNNDTGILDSGAYALDVSDCTFESNDDGYFCLGASSPQVSDCNFVGGQRRGIGLLGATGAVVRRCSFPAGRVGIQLQQGSTGGLVSDCTFGVLESASIVLVSFSSAQVTDCTMPGSLWGVTVSVGSSCALVMDRCFVGEGAAGWSIDTQSPAAIEVTKCDILPGAGLAIKLYAPGLETSTIDMTLNYWGTTDPQEIADLIWDATDDSTTLATVIFEPFANQPLPTEKATMSGFKGMYRNRGQD